METMALLLLIYGIVIAAGGVMGYVSAKSAASLVSGGIAGVIVVSGALLAARGNQLGYVVDLAAAIALVIFFAYRLVTTGKMVPAVPSLVLSLGAIVVAILALRRPT